MSLSASELEFEDVAPAAEEHDRVELNDRQKRIVAELTGKSVYDAQRNCVRVHTHSLVALKQRLGKKIRGNFESDSSGSTEYNAFMYPTEDGGWNVIRFGKNVREHESWRTSANGWTCCDFDRKRQKKDDDPAATIVELAKTKDELCHSPDGCAYAIVTIHGHREVLKVREERYRQILRRRYNETTGKVAKNDWLRNAVDEIEAIAVHDCPERLVYLRVAPGDGCVWLDLGNTNREVVQVTASGWKITRDPPVLFCRPSSMQPLATPETGGKANELWQFVNVAEADRVLFLGSLCMMLNPHGPFPIVSLVGRGGSAKSTTARHVQDLIDATIIVGSSEVSNDEELMIVAQQRWLVGFDNLSVIARGMSDSLCRLSTGGTHTRRKKYSDGETSLFKAKRPVLLTSINDVVTASDLMDRTIRLELPAIVDRKSEAQLQDEFAKCRGRILGVLLDGVSSALRNLPTTKLKRLPRLADFAVWATAAEEGLGLPAGSVMDAYWLNRGETTALILDCDLARAIIELARTGFSGTATELAKAINWDGDNGEVRKMANDLRYLAAALEENGTTVTFGEKSHGRRLITIGCPTGDRGTPVSKT